MNWSEKGGKRDAQGKFSIMPGEDYPLERTMENGGRYLFSLLFYQREHTLRVNCSSFTSCKFCHVL